MGNVNLCDETLCTGCGACESICPVRCINMTEDKYGELHPNVDKSRCIECGACVRACHIISKVKKNKPQHGFVAVRKNKNELTRCASGGIGTLLMERAFSKGWKVFSTRYNEEFEPAILEVRAYSDIEKYKGSRYVQGITGDALKIIKEYLLSGRYVLFIGTPCQVAGLYSFLGKNYDRLICCDLFCHGVVPSSYFKQELEYHRFKEYDNITFRGWNKREDFWFIVWNKGKKVLAKQGNVNYYIKGFADNVILREGCYNCGYSCAERVGDLSIGDFFSYDSVKEYNFKINGVTSIVVNTDKGMELVNEVMDELEYCKRPIEETIKGGIHSENKMNNRNKRKKFLSYYEKNGFANAVRKTLKKDMICAIIKRYINFIRRKLRLIR